MSSLYLETKEGSSVNIKGWILSIREQKTILFLIVVRMREQVQLVIKDPKLIDKCSGLNVNTAIEAVGTVKRTDRVPSGFEIEVKSIKTIVTPKKRSPFDLIGKNMPGIETRLDMRSLDLRHPLNLALFKLRAYMLSSIREHLTANGFLEVNTPKIIATASEGGAALFPIMYYDKEAFLAQSPQLYKEELVMSFERVFEIGPIFRAEPSHTVRHLSEATSLDAEAAFFNNEEMMELLERTLVHVLEDLAGRSEMAIIKAPKITAITPFSRFKYGEIVDRLASTGFHIEFGDDLDSAALKAWGDRVGGFYFITEWPNKLKPFYIKPKDDKVSFSFDLMYREIELSSGGERIYDRRVLEKRIREAGLPVQAFKNHLSVYDYGMPPHAGFGVGIERLLMVIAGLKNIRDAVLYPRDIRRLTP
ncbi:MAG: aspartate--tRNA(Asn) ligase [Nitrososphaerota archaeon]|nr:aspartate--tRNA(Asn) ligase [Nitrososphaerota archaeon]MDG7039296.1 aspartate--tRNA(Asn) ligase [Nitrososphaerota archaeon]